MGMQQVNERNVIEFKTANTAATHLGRKLYTSSPSALAELVANSYDAYATRVSLEVERNGTRIVVADNGVGMALEALQGEYAQVGKAKTAVSAPHGMSERRAMGKKGIGKLASFSLGDEFTVYTRDSKEADWLTFTVRYSDMVAPDHATTYETPYRMCANLPDDLDQYEADTGFVVIIDQLRRKITKSTVENLNNQLVRRFSVTTDDFEIAINGEPVSLSHADYLYKHIQSLNYVGFSEEHVEEQFSAGTTIEPLSPPRDNRSLTADEFSDLIEVNGVKAWVGAVDKPKRLKEIGLGGIVVYINGKIADEDLLKGNASAQMGGQYVTGEIYADYLNDRDEEPITSSRQGLDQSDEEVENLVALAKMMESRAIAQWAKESPEVVHSSLPKNVQNDEKFKNWKRSLSPAQNKFHQSLLGSLRPLLVEGEGENKLSDREKTLLINGFTTLVENFDQLRIASKLDSNTSMNSEEFATLIGEFLGKLATQDKLQMAMSAQYRLEAIMRLEELEGKDRELEKTFEKHLFENPWLLNPFWNTANSSESEVRAVTQKFVKIRNEINRDGSTGFIDICVEVAEERFPVIVELKRADGRGHSSPAMIERTKIIDQIGKYRQGLWEALPLEDQAGHKKDDIKAIFIAPSSAVTGHDISGLSEEDIQKLQDGDNIKVITYKDLITQAKRSYREFFKAVQESDRLPYFAVTYADEESNLE